MDAANPLPCGSGRGYTKVVAPMKPVEVLVFLFFQALTAPACEGPPDLVVAVKAQPTAPTHIALGVWFAQRKDYSCAIPSFETALRFNPNSWEAHHDLALALIATGRVQKAEEHLRAALSSAPDTAQVPFHLGQILTAQRRYSAAVPYLQEAVRMAPSLPARLALGSALAGSGRLPEALKTLEELVSAHPESAEAQFTLANLYAKREQYAEAAEAYTRTLKLDPGNDVARLAGAKALAAASRNDEALPLIKEYLAGHPQDVEALYIQGLANRSLARYAEAETVLLRAAALNPRDYKVQYNLGFVQEKLRKFEDAKSHLEQAGAIRPAEAEVHFRLASVFRGLRDAARAEEQLKIFQSIKEREQGLRKAELGTNGAQQLLERGNASAAAELYREALKFEPDNAKTLFDLSLALNKLGDYIAEREALERAVTLNPQFTPAHNQLGLRHMADGRLAMARKEFLAALDADPQFAEARNNLGVLSGQQGRHAEAERMFRQAVEDDPTYVKARVNLALILAAQQRLADAEKEIEAAIQMAPGSEDAKRARAAIQTQIKR
jgi:tetratricopeptide (TPR) repeat protein